MGREALLKAVNLQAKSETKNEAKRS